MKTIALFMIAMVASANAAAADKERIFCIEGQPKDYLARLSIDETIRGRLAGLGGFSGVLSARFICDDDVQEGKLFCAGLIDKSTGAADRIARVEIERKNMKAVMETAGQRSELKCRSNVR